MNSTAEQERNGMGSHDKRNTVVGYHGHANRNLLLTETDIEIKAIAVVQK